MPRFSDKWVIDKALFEHTTNGGNCTCCSFSTMFLPGGLKSLIHSVSDLETDAADAEYAASQRSPWPTDMRDQVWGDRVRLRTKMKAEIKLYRAFMDLLGQPPAQQPPEGNDDNDDSSGKDGRNIREERLKQWCIDELGAVEIQRLFQMPRAEVVEQLNHRYGIHSAFGTVVASVVEQVSNFELTKLEPDGRGDVELNFEKVLGYDRRGGFIIKDLVERRCEEVDDGIGGVMNRMVLGINEDVLDVFVKVFVDLGGPKLLNRGPSTSSAGDGEDSKEEGGADDVNERGGGNGPSFRSDRRIIRLMIARYWADRLISKYKAMNDIDPDDNEKGKEKDEIHKLSTRLDEAM